MGTCEETRRASAAAPTAPTLHLLSPKYLPVVARTRFSDVRRVHAYETRISKHRT